MRSKADQDLAEGLDRAVTAINKVYYEQGRVDTLDWRTQCDKTSDSLLRSCFVVCLAGQLPPAAARGAWRRLSMTAMNRWAQVPPPVNKDMYAYAVPLSEGKSKDPLLLVRGTLQLFVSAVASNPSAVTDITAFSEHAQSLVVEVRASVQVDLCAVSQ